MEPKKRKLEQWVDKYALTLKERAEWQGWGDIQEMLKDYQTETAREKYERDRIELEKERAEKEKEKARADFAEDKAKLERELELYKTRFRLSMTVGFHATIRSILVI